MEVLTDRPEERFRPGVVLHPEGSEAPLTIRSAEPVADGPGWRLIFQEAPDRTTAEALRGAYLEVVVSPAQALGRGEYFWHEVIGNRVVDAAGVELGTVRDMYRVGVTEVLVVAGGPHGEFDVPVVRSLIRVFAPRRGEIVVDAEALDLGAPAPEPDPDTPRPRAPRRRSRKGAGAAPGALEGRANGAPGAVDADTAGSGQGGDREAPGD